MLILSLVKSQQKKSENTKISKNPLTFFFLGATFKVSKYNKISTLY